MRKKRKMREKTKREREKIEDIAKDWDPQKDQKATGDPYRTLFVAKINFNTSEHKLKREFEIYGPIKKVRVIQDKDGKPRGYAFIEYEREKDMRNAYKQADGKKIDGRRVLVDVERGRTVRNWRPRRFAGGLGNTRASMEELAAKRESSRDKEHERDRGDRDRERERTDKGERGDRERDRGEKRHRDRSRERERERDRSPKESH